MRKDPFKTTDAVLLAVCILFEIATLPALSAAARSFRLSRIIRIFSRLVRFVATLRRIKGTKDDGSGLTALDALRWTATWTTAHTPWMMVKCVLWLLAQCVHPVLEPLLVRYLFDVALGRGLHQTLHLILLLLRFNRSAVKLLTSVMQRAFTGYSFVEVIPI